MRLLDKMRDGIRHFLRIQDAPKQTFNIRELLNYDGNCVKNLIWYRGDSYELTQLYQNIPGGSDGVKFWAARSTVGREIRKIHTGLPGIIVDRLTDIIINDFSQITFAKDTDKRTWDDIAEDNNFKEILKKATSKMLVLGDGAFKISLDTKISQYPIIEFYGADKVVYTAAAARQKKRLTELGYGNLPICMAKNQYSLSDDPKKLGRPEGFDITIREIYVNAGAGFLVALTGDVMTMPGLPKKPAAEGIDVNDDGVITGLF